MVGDHNSVHMTGSMFYLVLVWTYIDDVCLDSKLTLIDFTNDVIYSPLTFNNV